MIKLLFLLPVVLCLDLTVAGQSTLLRSNLNAVEAPAVSESELSWNVKSYEAPFQRLRGNARSEFPGQLVYPEAEFAFPLLQVLSFAAECDCYSLMVSRRLGGPLEIVQLWRAQAGFYRTAIGPYLELEQLDSLKAVTTLRRTRFLFAQVGDGEWRCVSIHAPNGSYLLVDYRADGLIDRLRDSFARTAVPMYDGSRLRSLTQTWTNQAGREMKSIVE